MVVEWPAVSEGLRFWVCELFRSPVFIAFEVVYGLRLIAALGSVVRFLDYRHWFEGVWAHSLGSLHSVSFSGCVFPVLRNSLYMMPGSCTGWLGGEGSSCVRGWLQKHFSAAFTSLTKVSRLHLRQVYGGCCAILSGSWDTDWCLDKFTWLFGTALHSDKDTETVCEHDSLSFTHAEFSRSCGLDLDTWHCLFFSLLCCQV